MKQIASTNQLLACGLLGVLLTSANAAPKYVAPDFKATRGITALIESGQCKSAVEALKPSVKSKHPDVLLLAGTMYEEGLCVQRNWEKAASFYLLANEAGNGAAIPRLIAGYAIAGRDNGLALWWAAKAWGTRSFPGQCLPASDPDANPDGFNNELERMPPALFQGCVYLAGVVGEMYAQMQFPPLALHNGVTGSVTMEFRPGAGTITWRQGELNVNPNQGARVRNMAQADLDNPRTIKTSLLDYMKGRGEFALSRYRKPERGLDPEFVFPTTFHFEIGD